MHTKSSSWQDDEIIDTKKLQFCRQTNQLICQDHRVQFVYGSYSHLFLHNKYLG